MVPDQRSLESLTVQQNALLTFRGLERRIALTLLLACLIELVGQVCEHVTLQSLLLDGSWRRTHALGTRPDPGLAAALRG